MFCPCFIIEPNFLLDLMEGEKTSINNNSEKQMAALYFNLYVGCLKYKKEKETQKKKELKRIDCQLYYQEYAHFRALSVPSSKG